MHTLVDLQIPHTTHSCRLAAHKRHRLDLYICKGRVVCRKDFMSTRHRVVCEFQNRDHGMGACLFPETLDRDPNPVGVRVDMEVSDAEMVGELSQQIMGAVIRIK